MAIDQDITNLPTPPSRSDSPSDFSDKADTFLAALPQLQTELNLYADEANTTQTAINTSETNAATSESNAQDWAVDLTGLVLSTDYSAKAYAISDSLIPEGAAKEWSLKTDGSVDTTEFSAKAYALGGTGVTDVVGAAKEWAIKTGSTVDGADFSAKKYAQDSSNFADAAAATVNATEWQSGTTYDEFDAVIGSDGNTYRSLTNSNLGNDPVSGDGSNWLQLTATTPDLVLKPQPVEPADGATDIGETPTLDGGNYYSLYGKTHAISRFQVADDDQFSNIVYDSGEISATETHDVPLGNLVESTNYYWRVYYEDEDGVESEFSDTFEFTTSNQFFDYTDPANIGTAVNGGFLVGVIDTVAGTIDSQDDYQTGERYALIVAPKSLETTSVLKWDSNGSDLDVGSVTRWDGLSSTENILSKNETSYEAFEHIRSVRSSDPAPSDGGSDWYLPAMDELELIYRNLKPVSGDNATAALTKGFPGQQPAGFNPSSDPTGSAYTSTGEPFQTSVTDFQNGGAEAVDLERYWSSTDADDVGEAWLQSFTGAGFFGGQEGLTKDFSDFHVRPVRRVSL